jgi:hypothetical protein
VPTISCRYPGWKSATRRFDFGRPGRAATGFAPRSWSLGGVLWAAPTCWVPVGALTHNLPGCSHVPDGGQIGSRTSLMESAPLATGRTH